MKTTAVFVALVAMAVAAPQEQPTNYRDVHVTKEIPLNNVGLGDYKFGYELSDGTTRHETGTYEARGVEDGILRVRGSYSWVDPKSGQVYTVEYIADENGFQPQAVHLPKPLETY